MAAGSRRDHSRNRMKRGLTVRSGSREGFPLAPKGRDLTFLPARNRGVFQGYTPAVFSCPVLPCKSEPGCLALLFSRRASVPASRGREEREVAETRHNERLSTLIEGESLFNDGVAGSLYQTFLTLALPGLHCMSYLPRFRSCRKWRHCGSLSCSSSEWTDRHAGDESGTRMPLASSVSWSGQ